MIKERKEHYGNTIEYRVYGPYALFTDPLTRLGGEKFSYPVPTYEALLGITSSIYYKPTIKWVIDEVRVMNRIEMQPKGTRPVSYMDGAKKLSIYTYLKDVDYRVRAHFEWNEAREDLSADRDPKKHHEMALRSVEKGGRFDVYLGTRECQALVEPCVFEDGESYYDNMGDMMFGTMFHGIDYPEKPGDYVFATIRLWMPTMKDGVIKFIRPEECVIKHKAGISRWTRVPGGRV